MGTKKGRYKVKKLGPKGEAFVHRLRADDLGYRSIAQKGSETFNVDISHTAIKNYLENASNQWAEEVGRSDMEAIKREKLEKVLEVETQLQEINDKLQTAIDSLDETDPVQMKRLVDVAKEIREQLKFHKKFIEQVAEPDTQINMNKTQIAIKVNKELDRLEDEGIIEIKKPQKLNLPEEEEE